MEGILEPLDEKDAKIALLWEALLAEVAFLDRKHLYDRARQLQLLVDGMTLTTLSRQICRIVYYANGIYEKQQQRLDYDTQLAGLMSQVATFRHSWEAMHASVQKRPAAVDNPGLGGVQEAAGVQDQVVPVRVREGAEAEPA